MRSVTPMWRVMGGAGVVVLVGTLLSACTSEEPAPLPGRWVELSPMGRRGSIELRSDGTGTFDQVPLWQGGGRCDLAHAVLYTGDVTWVERKHRFVVESPASEIVISADTAPFGLDWDKLVVGVCGEDTPSDQLIVYDGGGLQAGEP